MSYNENVLSGDELMKYGYIDARRMSNASCLCNLSEIVNHHKAVCYLEGMIKARQEEMQKRPKRFMTDKQIEEFIAR